MTPPPVAVFNSAVPSFFVSEVAVKSEISFANAFAPLIDYYAVQSHILKRKKRYVR